MAPTSGRRDRSPCRLPPNNSARDASERFSPGGQVPHCLFRANPGAWSTGWPRKLATEVRKTSARFGVIVSGVLPAAMDGSGPAGDVWVCDYGYAWDLAAGLRQAIIAVYRHEAANAARAAARVELPEDTSLAQDT